MLQAVPEIMDLLLEQQLVSHFIFESQVFILELLDFLLEVGVG